MINIFMEELHLFIASFVADDQQHNVPYFGKKKILYNTIFFLQAGLAASMTNEKTV